MMSSAGHGHGGDGPMLADLVPGLRLPPEPDGALDVGCGAGDDVRWMHGAGFRAIGIDVNADALSGAADRTPSGVDVAWIEARATALPVEDSSCVLVTDRGCMHHLPAADWPAYAAEVARVLAPGGVWVIRDIAGHHHDHNHDGHEVAQLDADAIADLARDAGLLPESIEIVDGYGRHRWLVAVLRRA